MDREKQQENEEEARHQTNTRNMSKLSDHANKLAGMTNEKLVLQMKEWLQWLNEVEESSQSAVFVFNDLLNYDKITNGNLDVEYCALNPLDFVNTAIHPFFVQAKQAGIELQVIIEERLSEAHQLALADTRTNADAVTQEQKEQKKAWADRTSPSRLESGSAFVSQRVPYVLGDSIKLGQVVKNLVSNALKFASSGGKITVNVTWIDHTTKMKNLNSNSKPNVKRTMMLPSGLLKMLENYVPAGNLLVSVTDTGAGLSSDNLKNLFKEGVQFNVNQLQAGGGSGLGLWIAKGVVDLHAGVLSASSPGLGKEEFFIYRNSNVYMIYELIYMHFAGLGSTFCLELPLLYERPPVTSDQSLHQPLTKSVKLKQAGSGQYKVHVDSDTDGDFRRASSTTTNDTVPTSADTNRRMLNCNSSNCNIDDVTEIVTAMRILVVDDAKSNRRLVCHLLKSQGHTCCEAEDGQQCVDMVQAPNASFDVILMDFGEYL